MTRSLSSRRLFRRLRDTSGNTMIEAAMITPLVLLLTFGIMEFATMFYVYLALENGVSQATRYGVTGQLKDDPMNPGTPLNRTESMKLAMRQATPTLTIPDARVLVQPSARRQRYVGGRHRRPRRNREDHGQPYMDVHDAADSAVLHGGNAEYAGRIVDGERKEVQLKTT